MRKAITSVERHPEYDKFYPLWEQLFVTTVLGEDGVKKAGTKYLPMTEGQIEDGDEGKLRYESYKTRALYYNFCQQTIKKAMGLLHSKSASLVCSEKMQRWTESMTIDGEDIHSLARDISTEQLLLGRMGLLLDYPKEKSELPYVVKYSADAILCWQEKIENQTKKLRFVLLDDSYVEFNDTSKNYEEKESFRLLALDKKGYYYTVTLSAKEWSVWDIDNPNEKDFDVVYPQMPRSINFIPFVPVNIKTTTMKIEKPLLVELSNLSISAYRADADYRQGLYMQAFALLYMLGISEKEIKEKGVRSDGFVSSPRADAKVGYASAPADGIEEMRMSIEAIKKESEGNGIVINDKEGVESGTALKTRISLQTSDLREINSTAGEAIYKILKMAQLFLGDKNPLSYDPNLDFDQEKATTQEYLNLWNVCLAGGTSLRNVYYWAYKNDMAVEPTYETWLANNQESMTILGFVQPPESESNTTVNNEEEKNGDNE